MKMFFGAVMLCLAGCSTFDSDFKVCEAEIRSATKNPSKAKIPYVSPVKSTDAIMKDSHLYIWKRGEGLEFQNGFGAMMDHSAECGILSGAIYSLQIDGESVPPASRRR